MEHSLAATLWRLVGLLALVLRQRLLRRRGVLDRHGAQDAHRPDDRRRASRRAGGAARGVRARSLHRRHAARHHDGEPRPRLDRPSRRWPSIFEPALTFLPAHLAAATAHSIAVAIAFAIITAADIVLRRAGAEVDRARAAGGDGDLARQADRAVHARVLAVHPAACTAPAQGVVRMLGLRGGDHAAWCTRKKS